MHSDSKNCQKKYKLNKYLLQLIRKKGEQTFYEVKSAIRKGNQIQSKDAKAASFLIKNSKK